jgi:hypothetical protein
MLVTKEEQVSDEGGALSDYVQTSRVHRVAAWYDQPELRER